jgi:predicted aminopeptidase
MSLRSAAAMLALVLLAGCDTLAYYGQAIGGHLDVMASSRPVATWLTDPQTPADLRGRLQTSQRIREFASQNLGLPDNGSYRSYAELGRRYVVWNVFAAPEFSVDPKKECFPFTGCVSYRGFYSEERARSHAAKLKAEGFDVYVGGVAAYSTLGWFDDPLLSTFIRFPEAQLARLIFHELAHQVAYAPNDTTFNESFAVAVEEEGVRRWLDSQGRSGELEVFRAAQARRRQLAQNVKETRERLAEVYQAGASPEALRKKKAEEFERLRAQYPGIVPAEPNNAFLVSVGLYTDLVPAFEQLLHESGSLDAFYARVRELAKSGEGIRQLKPPGPAASAKSAASRRSS